MLDVHIPRTSLTRQEPLELLRQQNEALRASREQLELALRAARMGVWDWEVATGRVAWAGEHARLFGIGAGDFGGTIEDVQACVHPDDRAQGLEVLRRTLEEGAEFDNTYRVVWPDGSIRWMHSLGRLMRDAGGVARRIIGVTRDITARREAERQMAALSAVVRHSDSIVVIKDPDLRVIATNPTFARLAGYASADEMIGKTDAEIFGVSPETEPVRSYMRDEREAQRLPPGAVLMREEPVLTHDGRQLCYLTKKYPIHDASGRLIATANISVDITQRRELEQRLLDANAEARALAERAEAANQAKSAFLANMSHEIRTPLNAILGFCYLIEQHPLEPAARELARKIHNAGESLLTLINDILDFSKIEAGRLAVEAAPFRLSELLDTLAGIMNAAAGDKPLELILTPPDCGIEHLIGDGARLRQVLINLLGNAIKFTERGEVELRIDCLGPTDTGVDLRFAVRDTGIGIAPEQQREIFAAFSQADTSIGRRFGGTGLGLAISQQLVRLMGGHLEVESAPGAGSLFQFTLSLGRDPTARPGSDTLRRLRLLVADDCSTAGAALANTARTLGWTVHWVASGAAARACLLERLDTVMPYDAVLFDWRMPGEDGLHAARTLRAELTARAVARPPAILLMASPQARPALLAQAGGATLDGILDKPVTPSALYNALARLLDAPARPEGDAGRGSARAPGQPLVGVHVLVVDDSPLNLEVAEGILAAHGANVSLVGDGEAALTWLAAHPEAADIVLMDVQMPRLDGYAATRRIRQEPRWRDLPVVALTAGAFQSMQEAARAAGMNDFIAKPFEVGQLITCVQRWTDPDPDRPAPRPAARVAPNADPDAWRRHGIDLPAALERWGDARVHQDYLAKFRDHHAGDAQAIAAAIARGSSTEAAALAHRLAGVAGTLALPRVARLARDLEQALKADEGADPDGIRALREAIDEVCRGIRTWTGIARAPGGPDPLDRVARADLLARLRMAIEEQDLGQAESLLDRLRASVAEDALVALRSHLADFDFRAAETLLRALD